MGGRQDVRIARGYAFVFGAHGWSRFNIYIYDYCSKRGFKQTAQHLMSEAEIPPDAKPPINARQGLLFECVVCFLSGSSVKVACVGRALHIQSTSEA